MSVLLGYRIAELMYLSSIKSELERGLDSALGDVPTEAILARIFSAVGLFVWHLPLTGC